MAHLHLIQVDKSPLSQQDALLQYLEKTADVTAGKIHCTGYDAHVLHDVMSSRLAPNATMETHDEFDCTCAGLVYLLKHPALEFSDWILPSETALEDNYLDSVEPLFKQVGQRLMEYISAVLK